MPGKCFSVPAFDKPLITGIILHSCDFFDEGWKIVCGWNSSSVCGLTQVVLTVLFSASVEESTVAVLAIDWRRWHGLGRRQGRLVGSCGTQTAVTVKCILYEPWTLNALIGFGRARRTAL